ncbi:hypothetical protein RCH10_004589 [Variovorax sp. GrIS 2.14]
MFTTRTWTGQGARYAAHRPRPASSGTARHRGDRRFFVNLPQDGGEATAEPAIDLKALHAKIGQLALENDFLEGALIKAGMLSAKR